MTSSLDAWWIQFALPSLAEAERRLGDVVGVHDAVLRRLDGRVPVLGDLRPGSLEWLDRVWLATYPQFAGRVRTAEELARLPVLLRASAAGTLVQAAADVPLVEELAHAIAEYLLRFDSRARWGLYSTSRVRDPHCRQPAVIGLRRDVSVGSLAHVLALKAMDLRRGITHRHAPCGPSAMEDVMKWWAVVPDR